MSVQLCAEAVSRADPDRFRAIMAAPVAAREVLFPVAAFMGEIARAPWVTQEPMIAQMRLQWWRDALGEIASGGQVRRHEVATPLAAAITPEEVPLLMQAVEAREWDIGRDPHDSPEALRAYLDATGAAPLWAAMQVLGAPDTAEPLARAIARAGALSRYFAGIPALEAAGRLPLPDGRPEAVAALAREGLAAMHRTAGFRRRLGLAGTALYDAVVQGAALRQAVRDPASVGEGRYGLSEGARRWRLLRLSLTG